METDEPEVEEGEERLSKDEHPKVKEGTFQIVGTVANKNERRPSYVLDEYFVSNSLICVAEWHFHMLCILSSKKTNGKCYLNKSYAMRLYDLSN